MRTVENPTVRSLTTLYSLGRQRKFDGLKPSLARLARRFADPTNGYAPEELDQLLHAIRTQDVQGDESAFSQTHLVRLLTVRKSQRTALQDTILREKWSIRRLDNEIRMKLGVRRNAGRKKNLPTTTDGLLVYLEELCESWRRLDRRLQERTGYGGSRLDKLGSMTPLVAQRFREISPTLHHLHEAVVGELQNRRRTRQVRPGILSDDRIPRSSNDS